MPNWKKLIASGSDASLNSLNVKGTIEAASFDGNFIGTVGNNLISANQLNVTGNGTTSQYLRSDGDGTFTWATPPNTTYSVGDGGLTEKNFTSTLKTKLDGIATSANNYSLPEATATTRGGIELFSNTDQAVAANTVSATAGRTYGIQLNSAGQAVVNVPWADTNTNTTYSAGTGLTLSGTTFSLTTPITNNNQLTNGAGYTTNTGTVTSVATNSGLTGGTITTSGTIGIASNGVTATHLNVTGNGTTSQFLRSDGDGTFTWATPTDTNTTYSVGDGGLTQKNFTTTLFNKLNGIATSADNYGGFIVTDNVESADVTSGEKVVFRGGGATEVTFDAATQTFTISSTDTNTDTNTTYSAGTGLTLSGTTFSHTDTSSQGSVNNSGRTYIQDITLDTYGHITGITSATETVVNTDTNTQRTDAEIRTVTSKQLVEGDNVTLSAEGETIVISSTDTNTTYSVGDGGLTQKNFTTTLKNKLDGIAAGATNVTNNNQLTNGAGYQTAAQVSTAISGIVDSAPDTLNTLNELAAALGDDPNFATTLSTSIGTKLAKASNLSDLTNASTARTNLGLGTLATLSSVNAATITDNSVGAAELNVTGNGTTSQFLRSDGDGTFTWATPTDTNTTYSVGDGGLTQKNFTTTLFNKLNGIAASADNYGSWTISDGANTEGIGSGATLTIRGAGASTAEYDAASNTLTISSTDTNTNTNYFLNGITKSGNTLTFSVSGTTNQTYVFGSNAFTSYSNHVGLYDSVGSAGAVNTRIDEEVLPAIPTNNNQLTNGAGYITSYVNTQRSDEEIRDVAAAQWINGTNTTVVKDDTNNTIKINSVNTNTTYSAGSGISLSGTTFSNSAPDQTVSLTGAGATTISGTYPNFTITSTDTNTDTNTTYTAGGGLTLSGTTFSHTDTSSQSSVNNSGRTYIQDITLDTYGHITGITSATETVVNTDTNTQRTDVEIREVTKNQLVAGDNVTLSIEGETIIISSTDTNTTYSVGDGGLTQKNFTTTLKNKLDGIATSANNYSLPEATATTRGGIELFSNTDQSVAANAVTATASRTYGIQLNSAGQAVVNVPWSDTNTNTTYSAGTGLTLSGTTFSLTTPITNNNQLTNGAGYQTAAQVSTAIQGVVDSAPAALDTLNELAAALGDDANFAGTVTTALAGKLSTTGKAADSNLLDGLDLHTGRNNEVNKVVRTNASGYAEFGWINTTSGATTSTITDFFVNTNDGYIRKATPAHVKSQLGLGSAAYVNTSAFDSAGTGADAAAGVNTRIDEEVLPAIPTNNNQLTNGAGYTTNVGDITGVTAGGGLTGGGTSGTVTLSHSDTSSQGSVNNSGRTYIQDITLDTYGHITGITSATETVVNTDTNTVTSIRRDNTGTYRTGNINLVGGSNVTITETSAGVFSFASTDTNTNTTYSAGTGLTLSGTTFSLTTPITNNNQLTNGAGYTTNTGTVTSVATNSGLTGGTITTSGTIGIASNGVTATHLNVTGNGTTSQYLRSDGDGTFTWATPPDTNTNTTYSAGSGISLSGTTFSHSDTSSQGSVNNSGRTYIQDITLDTYGHITGIVSATETVVNTDTDTITSIGTEAFPSAPGDFVFIGKGATTINQEGGKIYIESTDTNTDTNTTYSAGSGISLSGTTFSHSDTSSQGSVNNSGRTYIQDITLDGYGHIIGITSATETVVNTDTNTTYSADGNYGLTLSGTTFRLEDDRRRNSTTTDIYSGNTHDYTWYDADVGIRWYTAGAEEMRLQNDGTLHVDGDVVAYSTTVSDERLKDNVTTIQNPLDKIKALRGVEYDWNAGNRKGKRDLGLIAQEVEMVIPEIVHEHELPLIDGESGTIYKTVDYEKMVAVLIEGMKEQQSQIDELKSEISKLKGEA